MNLRKTCRPLVLLLVSLAVAAQAFAQDNVLTPELVLSLRHVTDAQLSPDGSRIAFQVTRPRMDSEGPGGSVSEIWMIPSGDGEAVRFTYNEKSDWSPKWSPDGRSLAFLSVRGASAAQVYMISVSGGEAMQITKSETSVSAFQWSPDGSRIAYVAVEAKTPEETRAEKEGRDWTIADRNYKQARLYTIDLKSKQITPVTRQNMNVVDFDWSPDSKQFVMTATETPKVDDVFLNAKLMVVPAAGGEPRLVAQTPGKLNFPRWSPDGKWIAWLGATTRNDPYAGSLFVIPSSGGSPENLLQGYEGTADWMGWQPGRSDTIVLRSIERQSNVLYTIAMSERKRNPLYKDAVLGSGPSFNNDGNRYSFTANTPAHPGEVFYGEVSGKKPERLTRSNPQLDGVALGQQEIVKWKSVDGWEIEGVIVKPVGYRSGTRYPLVVQPHGGPEAADLNGWLGYYSRWGQMLAGKGYVTFYPNYRGSIGRGVEFAKADHRDLMGKEFQDMVAGIDHLISEGLVDRNRVGIGGGSYGGYTSAWAATFASERFKAAVAWMGISNWYSMTGTSDIFLENSTVHWDLEMYDNYEIYLERSPIRHIKKANTPTLIIHGAVDPRVPPGQSQELYTALRWKGVPTEFVTYPRAGHGLAEKAHQYDFMQRVLGWFDKYLKNEVANR